MAIDVPRMEQVLTNLLSNAVKYCPPSGRIKISAAKGEKGAVEIAIKNSMVQEKGSQPFQVNSSVGFGLEIVREILKLHNSRLIIQDEGNDYKARFTLVSV